MRSEEDTMAMLVQYTEARLKAFHNRQYPTQYDTGVLEALKWVVGLQETLKPSASHVLPDNVTVIEGKDLEAFKKGNLKWVETLPIPIND